MSPSSCLSKGISLKINYIFGKLIKIKVTQIIKSVSGKNVEP